MKTIWIDNKKENIYAEFKKDFAYYGGKASLKLSASRNYAAFVNGCFASNAQFADVPEYKVYDEVDITDCLHRGGNTLTVIVFHWDSDFATGKVMAGALAFEIIAGGKTIAVSDSETLVREAVGYRKLDQWITPQIGYAYGYNFCAKPSEWQNAVLIDADFNYVKRPCKGLDIRPSEGCSVAAQGAFRYNGGNSAAEKCMNAWLKTERFSKMAGENRLIADKLSHPITFKSQSDDGIFVIFDLSRETAGYLTFDVTVPHNCSAIFTWGEHLADLRVRSEIDGRSFAAEFELNEGENRFDDYLHRIGARYLCIFVESNEITVKKFTVREAVYPFDRIDRKFDDRLIQKIYDTSVRTLELSAHEHYEDCPWREQALYGMDSRNQMLFGYSAFGEYELPRAALRLMAKTARSEGLIELCAPATAPIVIPSFTLFALLAIVENAEVDYNEKFVGEMLPYAEHAITAFTDRIGEYGVEAFKEKEYWNFHEWCDGLDGGIIFRDEEIEPYFDGPLTALCCVVLQKLAWLEQRCGKYDLAEKYNSAASRLSNILLKYYDDESGLYFSFIKNGERYGKHAYTQAMYLLTGAIPEQRKTYMLGELMHPENCVPMTLAALQLKYDAILKNGGDADYCINEVCEVFGKMLYSGATSFWETENGEADFDDAGSLCHGWSSVPCWLFDKLLD